MGHACTTQDGPHDEAGLIPFRCPKKDALITQLRRQVVKSEGLLVKVASNYDPQRR